MQSIGLPWWVSSKESACQETWVQSLDWGYSSEEEEMVTHSGILAWKIPLAEEPGGLQSMGSQRVGYDRVTKQQQQQMQSTVLGTVQIQKIHTKFAFILSSIFNVSLKRAGTVFYSYFFICSQGREQWLKRPEIIKVTIGCLETMLNKN